MADKKKIFLGIDWSGAKDARKGLAIAKAVGSASPHIIATPNQSAWRRQTIMNYIAEIAQEYGLTHQITIGIDANLSLPRAVLNAGGYQTPQELWQDIAHHCHEDFYGVPFIHKPAVQSYFWSQGRKPEKFDNWAWRETEQSFKTLGYHPASPCRLNVPGAVGSSGLSAMAWLHHFKTNSAFPISVWPFEEILDKTTVIITEVYPRIWRDLLPHKNSHSEHECDALQIVAGLQKYAHNWHPPKHIFYQSEGAIYK